MEIFVIQTLWLQEQNVKKKNYLHFIWNLSTVSFAIEYILLSVELIFLVLFHLIRNDNCSFLYIYIKKTFEETIIENLGKVHHSDWRQSKS